ncbi:MAG: hypothetical protein ACE5JX_00005 [Acidobacteriota bacterium]
MNRILIAPWAVVLPFILSSRAAEITPAEVIQRFARKESDFNRVWQQYTYTQTILFQVIGPSNKPREQRQVVVEVYFTKEGKRETRMVEDRGRLRSIHVSPEDLSDAISLQPFVLTTENLGEYKITFVNKERVDELDTYVFDVKPRKKKKGKRYFQGRIWVDDVDYQIVMTRGKIVPDYKNNKFPKFETLREQIDGEYWFPTWTEADDILHFGRTTGDVHVRQLITYENFQKFEVDTSIKYGPAKEPRQ